MENIDHEKLKRFLKGVQVFLELCGKRPDLTEEFIEFLELG